MDIAGVGNVAVPGTDLFTVTLAPDGQLAARADCNRCSGGYTVTGSTVRVGPLACTRAYCAGTAPVNEQFVRLLHGDSGATVEASSLTLTSARGTLRFRR